MNHRYSILSAVPVLVVGFLMARYSQTISAYTDKPPNATYDRTGSGGTPDLGSAIVTNGRDDIEFTGDNADTMTILPLGSAYASNSDTSYYEFNKINTAIGCHPNCYTYVHKNSSGVTIDTGELHDHWFCPPFGG